MRFKMCIRDSIIVFGAILILFTLEKSGGMETIQYGMQNISRDKRVQAIIIGYMSVSYTHLDVYKRQDNLFPRSIFWRFQR